MSIEPRGGTGGGIAVVPHAQTTAQATATVSIPVVEVDLTLTAQAVAQATMNVYIPGNPVAVTATAQAKAQATATVSVPAVAYSVLILGEPGLVSYWRLGETSGNALDSMGSNPGTTVGTGITRNVAGLITSDASGAASGDGSANDYITVPSSSSMDVGAQITVELWAQMSALSPAVGFGYAIDRGADSCFYIRNYGVGDARWEFTVKDSGNQSNSNVPSTPIGQVGVRQHLVMTYDGTRFISYINGVSVANSPVATPGAPVKGGASNNLILFNRLAGGVNDGFIGTIDEIALYNVALTQAQIATHYNAGVVGVPSPNVSAAVSIDLSVAPTTAVAAAVPTAAGTELLTAPTSAVNTFVPAA